MVKLTEYIRPCDPKEFVGMNPVLDEFTELMKQFKNKKTEKRSIVIFGENGTGKSSLLLKMASIVTGGRKEKSHFFDLLPEEENLLYFFRELKNKIDEFTPEWRKMFEKVSKKGAGDDLPSLNDYSKKPAEMSFTDYYVSKFFENFEKINAKLVENGTYIYLFIDNIELFKLMNIKEFYPIYSQIIKEFAEREYNIFLFTAFKKNDLVEFDYQSYLTKYSKYIEIGPLTSAEAEVFLRRKYPDMVKKGALDIVTNCLRTAFDLNLGVCFIKNDFTISDFVERNINLLLNMDEEEIKTVSELATYNTNLFSLEQIKKEVEESTISSLEEKGLLWIGSQYAKLTHDSLLGAIKFNDRLYQPLTTAVYITNQIIEKLGRKIVPTSQDLNKLKVWLCRIRDRLSIFALAARFREGIKTCISMQKFQTAYDLTLMTSERFESIRDYEQAGTICEEVAREFEEKQLYFAARLYVKAADCYTIIEQDMKAQRSYRRAYNQFEKLADSLDLEQTEYAIRGYFKWCLECTRKLGDLQEFERIKKKAKNKFKEGTTHYEYFYSTRFEKGEELPQIEVEPEVQTEKVSIEQLDLDKELDF